MSAENADDATTSEKESEKQDAFDKEEAGLSRQGTTYDNAQWEVFDFSNIKAKKSMTNLDEAVGVDPNIVQRMKIRGWVDGLIVQTCVIILIIIDLSIAFANIDEKTDLIVTIIILILYLIEICFRIYAYTPKVYFTQWFDLIDFLSVVLPLLITIFTLPLAKYSTFILLFRILRFVRIARATYRATFGRVEKIQKAIREFRRSNLIGYKDDEFNLDLAYITDNIIIMSKPSTTQIGNFEKDPLNDVARFLNTHHKGRYKIFDLCVYDLAPLTMAQIIDYESFGYTLEQFNKLSVEEKRKLYERQVRKSASPGASSRDVVSLSNSPTNKNENNQVSIEVTNDAKLLAISSRSISKSGLSKGKLTQMSTSQLLQLEQASSARSDHDSLHSASSLHLGTHEGIDRQWDKNDGRLSPEYHKLFPIKEKKEKFGKHDNNNNNNNSDERKDKIMTVNLAGSRSTSDVTLTVDDEKDGVDAIASGSNDNDNNNENNNEYDDSDDWILTHKYGFRGHCIMSLDYLLAMCEEMYSYLEEHKNNVVIIQSPSGLGRSLFAASCLLFYYYPTANLQDVVTFTRHERIKESSEIYEEFGFTRHVPSQKRFYQYFATLLSHCYATSVGEHIEMLRAQQSTLRSFHGSMNRSIGNSIQNGKTNNKASAGGAGTLAPIPSQAHLGDLEAAPKQDTIRMGEIAFDPELEIQLQERVQSIHDENLLLESLDSGKSSSTNSSDTLTDSKNSSSQRKKVRKTISPSLMRVYGTQPLQFLNEKIGIFIHRVKIGPLHKEMDPYAVWEVDVITFNRDLMDYGIKKAKKQIANGNKRKQHSLSKSKSKSNTKSSKSSKSNETNETNERTLTSRGNSKGNILLRQDSQHVNVQPYCSVYEKHFLGAIDVAGQSEAIVTNQECTKVFEGDFALRLYHVNNDHRKFRGQIWLHSHFLKYDKGSKKHCISFNKSQIDKMCDDCPKHEKFPENLQVTMVFTILKKK